MPRKRRRQRPARNQRHGARSRPVHRASGRWRSTAAVSRRSQRIRIRLPPRAGVRTWRSRRGMAQVLTRTRGEPQPAGERRASACPGKVFTQRQRQQGADLHTRAERETSRINLLPTVGAASPARPASTSAERLPIRANPANRLRDGTGGGRARRGGAAHVHYPHRVATGFGQHMTLSPVRETKNPVTGVTWKRNGSHSGCRARWAFTKGQTGHQTVTRRGALPLAGGRGARA